VSCEGSTDLGESEASLLTSPAPERTRFPTGESRGRITAHLTSLSDGAFDRGRQASAVGVVEVDDTQPRQGPVEDLVDVLWVSFYDHVWFSMAETKLCGEEDLVALSGFLNLTLPNRGQEQERTERAKTYDRCMRTTLQSDLRCTHRRRRCPGGYTRIRKRHPEPAVRTRVSKLPHQWRT